MLLGRLSLVGAARPPAGTPLETLLRRSREERSYPVVCRNLGLPCELEASIYAAQMTALQQAAEIREQLEFLPLKGLHLAHHLYPSPGLRDMGDLDLLVRPERVGEADAVLRRLGYRPDVSPEALRESTLRATLYAREDAMPVHLHWHVTNGSLPNFMVRIDLEEIWRDARDGRLAPHHLFITLCEHALKHSFSHLLHLTDLELAARGLDWDLVERTARRWGLERAVAYALVLLHDLAEHRSPGLDRFRRLRLDWSGRAFLALARRRRWDGLSALGLMSMTGEKGRFIRETLLPRSVEGLRTRSLMGRIGGAARYVGRGLTSWGPLPRH